MKKEGEREKRKNERKKRVAWRQQKSALGFRVCLKHSSLQSTLISVHSSLPPVHAKTAITENEDKHPSMKHLGILGC